MSITRISEFTAREGKDDALRAFLESIVPVIASSDGCRSSQLLQSDADPTRFLVIEVWDAIASHRASVKEIPSEMRDEMVKLLAGPPMGEYYRP